MKKSLIKTIPILFFLILFALILAFLDIRFIFLLKENIDLAFSGKLDSFIIAARHLILLQILIFPANLAVNRLRAQLKKRAILTMKEDYFKGLFKKNISEFNNENSMKYMSILNNDLNVIEISYIDAIIDVILGVISIIAAVYIVVTVNINILFMIMGAFLLVALISIFLSKPIEKIYKDRSTSLESYTSYVKEALSGFQIIKSNNLLDLVKGNFNKRADDFLEYSYKIDFKNSIIAGLQQLLFMTPFAGILVYMVYLAKVGIMTVGAVMAIANTMERLITPIFSILDQIPKIFSSRKLFEVMDKSLENIDDSKETINITDFKKSLKFTDVSFSYDDKTEVFNNLNIEFEKGKKYLVIGPSGGGKSTLLKLLRKYFKETNGFITIDGKNLKDVTKESYFREVSSVEQQVFLIEDSVVNNLTLYKDVDELTINRAIEESGLTKFISNLDNGLNTKIYDNGKNISGGEKSRLAIARALINGSDIMILDEAFASLDYETGKEIEKTILNIQNLTLINVSHAIFNENISKYDAILKVENKTIRDVKDSI